MNPTAHRLASISVRAAWISAIGRGVVDSIGAKIRKNSSFPRNQENQITVRADYFSPAIEYTTTGHNQLSMNSGDRCPLS
jgi:hypothetical protein